MSFYLWCVQGSFWPLVDNIFQKWCFGRLAIERKIVPFIWKSNMWYWGQFSFILTNLDLKKAKPPPSLLNTSPCSIVSGRGQFLIILVNTEFTNPCLRQKENEDPSKKGRWEWYRDMVKVMMRETMYETWSQAREERGLPQEGRWRRRWSTEPPERSLGQAPALGGGTIILIPCICSQGRVFQPTRYKLFQYSVIETCDPETNILLLTMVTMF